MKLVEEKKSFRWTPTDPDPLSLASINAYVDDSRFGDSVDRSLKLTLNDGGIVEEETRSALLESSVDVMMAINLIHISPWSATLGLMKTASTLLKSGGKLYLYGPYRVGGTCVESNMYVQ
jgi:hypothetical protein